MSSRNTRIRRGFAAALIATLFIPALIQRLPALTEKLSASGRAAAFAHDDKGGAKKGQNREQLIDEAWVWHESNRQRLERTNPLGVRAITAEVINQDINDISVI